MSEVQEGRLDQARNWKRMAYLNQGRIWKGRNGVEVEIKLMSPLHARRAASLLRKQHETLHQVVCSELLQMAQPPSGGQMKDGDRDRYFQERADMRGGSTAWIQRKPLMRALHRRGAQKEGEVGE